MPDLAKSNEGVFSQATAVLQSFSDADKAGDEHLSLKMGELLNPAIRERLYQLASTEHLENEQGAVANFAKQVVDATSQWVNEAPWTSIVTGFGAGVATGALTRLAIHFENQSAGESDPLHLSDAVSEVTGGFPEDINGMPANTDVFSDDPVYDGTELNHVAH